MMQIVPVLDIMQGVVVRAIGGRRSEYRPLASRLTTSTEPLAVAQAIRERYGFTEFYVADLDAIGGAPPALDLCDRLRANGFRVWVDAGVRRVSDVERIAEYVDSIVVGSETLRDSEALAEIGTLFLPSYPASEEEGMGVRGGVAFPFPKRGGEQNKQLIFSLDLHNGLLLGNWNTIDPLVIAERVIAAGINRLILLDLARVGTNAGSGTEQLARALIHRLAHIEIFVGGGVRSMDEVKRLEALGVSGVLVASALHDELL